MDHFIHLGVNTQGRDFVLADLNGQYDLLGEKMASVNFDIITDRIITTGNISNRGKDGYKCLNLIRQPWFYSVRGDAEHMGGIWFGRFFESMQKQDTTAAEEALGRLRLLGLHWLADIATRTTQSEVSPDEMNDLIGLVSLSLRLPYAMEVETEKELYGFVPSDFPSHNGEVNDWASLAHHLTINKEPQPWVIESLLSRHFTYDYVTGKDAASKVPVAVNGVFLLFSGNTICERQPMRIENRVFINSGSVFGRGSLNFFELK